MKIAVLMSREPTYTRNRAILDGLTFAGLDVIEYTDTGGKYPKRFMKILGNYLSKPANDVEVVFVGFFGQPFIPIVRRLTNKPIVLDAFLSGYDTMCFDRKRFPADSLPGRFFFWLDKTACELVDVVLLDTEEHARYFVETFELPAEKFKSVFIGADTSAFFPHPAGKEDGFFRVFYYCTYRPLHGTEYVIRAADLLKAHKDIKFVVVGNGQERDSIDELILRLGVSNVQLVDWITYQELPDEIARADVCLGGHFSAIKKASRVIPGKEYQFLAMGKPTIVGDNPANRELLTHRKDAMLVNMAEAEPLASAILELKNDPVLREEIAANGYRTFVDKCSTDIISRRLAEIIGELVLNRR